MPNISYLKINYYQFLTCYLHLNNDWSNFISSEKKILHKYLVLNLPTFYCGGNPMVVTIKSFSQIGSLILNNFNKYQYSICFFKVDILGIILCRTLAINVVCERSCKRYDTFQNLPVSVSYCDKFLHFNTSSQISDRTVLSNIFHCLDKRFSEPLLSPVAAIWC